MMPIEPIQTMIAPIQAILNPIATTGIDNPQAATEASAVDFKGLVKKALSDLNATQVNANDSIKALATGTEENLHDVIISMEQAGMTLQYAIEIRNKLLDAYQSVIQMQI
jgi:flagellar hook-basal body complex protein FliE